ncbi:glycoside hydrolase family 2 protein [Jiangella asiatica]|uniref:Glycoside hydrolase family 2 n=1 Tax=Jiangella asiatica TaxID=2530372 RepID=A0A4R5CP78_9ACTN|nr:glycoside hydrolase family 2 TIM barrel-domain containing protein [Jiangella asiatica]TDE00204.1 glycoside hydrolase family 2 [Jiangella asiatica]
MIDSSSYPRPRLVRDRWYDLCGTWRFAYDDRDHGIGQQWFTVPPGVFDRTIEVPYPPESKLSGVNDRSFHPVIWYHRAFDLPELGDDERLLLHFGAVDHRATVWLNEHHLTDHEGGHTPFTVDISDALDPRRDQQSLVVRAEDQPDDAGIPRGKQTWDPEPSGIFYERTSGIWQPVWLEPVPRVSIDKLDLIPDMTARVLRVELSVRGTVDTTGTLDVTLELGDRLLAAQSMRLVGSRAQFSVSIPGLEDNDKALHWSPESPTLMTADLSLRVADTVDRVRSYVGFREVGVRDGAFLLNGRPYYLRMVLAQGYWPESHLAAPSGDALRREVELIKELGFNGVRVHQKVEDPRFLYWCDRFGLLVWGEMANAHEFSARSADQVITEWADVVRRDRSHPCIVTWVPINESWGVPSIASSARQQHHARALYHLTKTLDPTRPVISNDGWEHPVSDIWSIHDYATAGADLRRRYGDPEALAGVLAGTGPAGRKVVLGDQERAGHPVVISEFGGLAYLPAIGEKWFGYRVVGSEDEFRAAFEELVAALIGSPEIAGFCYTQLTDTAQERNGLLTEDRTPKLPLPVLHEIITRPSSAVPSESIDHQRRRALLAALGTPDAP